MTVVESAECRSSVLNPHLCRGLAKPENHVMICPFRILHADTSDQDNDI